MKLASVAAGLMMVASAAQAQTVVGAQLTAPYAPPNAGTVTAYGYYMSPYSGTVDGTTQRLNCVDFFHDVMINQVWTATTTNLGAIIADMSLLQYTRDGSNGLYTPSAALAIYQKVAYLSDQYGVNPGANTARSTAIQTAIWAIANNQPNNAFTSLNDYQITLSTASVDPNSTGYWINQANTKYNTQAADYYNQFNILTDVNKQSSSSVQEFVYATPEPGTLAMMGSGLSMLVGVGMRRRRKGGSVGHVELAS